MHETMTRLYVAAKELRGISGQSGIARAMNASPQTVKNWESRGISKQGLLDAQLILGCDARWIETGIGEMLLPSSDIHPASSTGQLPAQQKTGEVMELRLAASRTDQDDDVFFIPRLDVKAKGGLGALAPANEFVIGSMTVTNSWINQRLPKITAKQNLAVIEAYGRSMLPTILSGDLLLVDMGVTEIKVEGIYILLRQNTPEPEIMVKRIQRKLDGGLIVRSDNRDEYDPETVEAHEIAEKISVVGKVVWIWAGREV